MEELSNLNPRQLWRPEGHVHGRRAAGGFHIPQSGRDSYLTVPRKGKKAVAVEDQSGGIASLVTSMFRKEVEALTSERTIRWCKHCSRRHSSHRRCDLIPAFSVARSGRVVQVFTTVQSPVVEENEAA